MDLKEEEESCNPRYVSITHRLMSDDSEKAQSKPALWLYEPKRPMLYPPYSRVNQKVLESPTLESLTRAGQQIRGWSIGGVVFEYFEQLFEKPLMRPRKNYLGQSYSFTASNRQYCQVF